MSLDDIEYRAHAILGPSGAKKWALCTMAPSAERYILEDTTHERTRYGTCGHLVLAECLEHNRDAETYLGRTLLFLYPRDEVWSEDVDPFATVMHSVTVDAEMVAKTLTIINYVRDLVNATGGELFVEQRLSIEHITRERGACGTTDVGILNRRDRELIILDAKYGFVKVYAQEGGKPNLQLAMYADAFLNGHDCDVDTVRLIIAQPFVNPPFNEAVFTRAELQAAIDWLAERAEKTRSAPEYAPSTESCMWCKAKATCQARTRLVMDMAASGFVDTTAPEPPPLGVRYEMLGLIRDWCNDQEKLVHAELHAGRPVVGSKGEYKLVEGANGDRVWSVPQETVAETLINEYWLHSSQIFSQKIQGPAKIEALSVGKRAVITKQAFKEIEARFVTRGPKGPPRVVLSTDPAPALPSATDGFVDVPD